MRLSRRALRTPRQQIGAALVVVLAVLAAFAAAADARTLRRPDDPRFARQWQLAHDGVMGARSAWRVTRGGDVTVAIVDTGVDLTHPDLRDSLWTNRDEVAGNGIDDDGDGYVDDTHGWDVVNRDPDPADDNGHGTHVAGIVAARGDNDTGIAGVAWRARIMAVKAVDASASAGSATVAEGIRYAVAHGARIVLLAMAGTDPGAYLGDAVRAASDAGALVVCAAGNDGRDLDLQPVYPASFDVPGVISVAATSRGGELSGLSNLGRHGVDIAAPGDGILSTAADGGYERRSGTSMAAATVAGALALMSAAAPDAGAAELRDALLSTAHHDGLPVAAGSLDIDAAVRRIQQEAR
jgi:subtilisin family serine protease